jgi:alpha-1,3/alpha-1,6-mannosyltransferase
MSFADSVTVNSGFTKSVVGKVWPDLLKKKDLQIVYPCVDIKEKKIEDGDAPVAAWKDKKIVLSINRFERKKDVGLAIKAYAGLGKAGREGVRLVLAGLLCLSPCIGKELINLGGYDNRVQENVVYHKELVSLAESLGLKIATTKTIVTALNVPDDVDVLFLLSVPNTLKDMLLKSARLLVYTPSNEHFGIVPLEAMLAGVPVLAANTGGPLETVVDGKTGWLCPPEMIESWTAVIDKVLHKLSQTELKKIGSAGTERVKKEFSDVKMAERLDIIISNMSRVDRRSYREFSSFLLTIGVVVFDTLYYLALHYPALEKKLGEVFLPPFVLTTVSLGSWITYLVAARNW